VHFEGPAAGIVAQVVQNCDETRGRCWIAEWDGAIIGSMTLVGHTERSRNCVRFAPQAGYRRITLWTKDVLHAVRRQAYERAGFRLIQAKPHDAFGRGFIGETWELEL